MWVVHLADLIYPALMGLCLFQALGTAVIKGMISWYGTNLWYVIFSAFMAKRWLRLWFSLSVVAWLAALAVAFFLLSLATGSVSVTTLAAIRPVLRPVFATALVAQASAAAAWIVLLVRAWESLVAAIQEARAAGDDRAVVLAMPPQRGDE